MNFKTHAPTRREGTTLQPNIHILCPAPEGNAGIDAAATGAVSDSAGSSYLISPVKSSQVNTLPIAKSKTRSKQNKDMHKFSSVHSERGVPLPVSTSGGE